MDGKVSPTGNLILNPIQQSPALYGDNFWENVKEGLPTINLDRKILLWRLRNFPNLLRGLYRVAIARLLKVPHYYGVLSLKVIKADGTILDYGTASFRVVTDVGVAFIVDAFQNTTELENLKFHGVGTDNTAEAAGDTALNTELTTEYVVDNTRATGTTIEGATGNIYRTVATNTFDAAVALVEHGILSQAATGGGTLLDRTVFGIINLSSGDSLQTTYDLTFTAGS